MFNQLPSDKTVIYLTIFEMQHICLHVNVNNLSAKLFLELLTSVLTLSRRVARKSDIKYARFDINQMLIIKYSKDLTEVLNSRSLVTASKHLTFPSFIQPYHTHFSNQGKKILFIIDNIFVQIGGRVFQKTIINSMDINCVPLLADLLLHSFEAEFSSRAIT